MSDCDPCKNIDCANEDDFSLYNLQSGQTRPAAEANTSEPCKGCGVIDCSDGSRLDDDFNLYRLQSELYPLVLPFGLNVPGAEIRLGCCGTDIVRIIPQGLSEGGLAFLFGQMLDECALTAPFCADGGTGGSGADAPPQYQLRLTCCDGGVVVRSIPLTTPDGVLAAIGLQMRNECALHSGCGSSTVLIGNLSDALVNAGVIILIAIEAVRDLFDAFISNDPAELLDAYTTGIAAVTSLEAIADTLRDMVAAIIGSGIVITPIIQAILDSITALADTLDSLAALLRGLSNLALVLSTGGDPTAAIQEIIDSIAGLINAANELDVAGNALLAVGGTPIIVLTANLEFVLADILRVLATLIDGWSAAIELVNAFDSGVPAELLDAAAHANDAANAIDAALLNLTNALIALQTALTNAINAGLLTPEQRARIQADIDFLNALIIALGCLADALRGLAAVATAYATGAGLAAALAALESIAVCLENSAAALIALGDEEAAAFAALLLELAEALRDLADGSGTAEDAARMLQRVLLIAITLMLELALRIAYDLDFVLQLLLNDVFGNLPEVTDICCDGHVVRRTFPPGLTASQRNAIFASMLAECAVRCPPVLPPGGGFGPDGQPIPIQLFASGAQSCLAPLCPDGSAFLWTLPAGRFIGTNQAQVNASARAQACVEAPLYRVCLSNLPVTYCIGAAFSANITSGGLSSGAGNLWTLISGALPTGLSLVPHGTYVTLQGTPTGTDEWNFTIQMVASNGARNSRSYTMNGLQVLPLTLPTFQVGTPYSQQLTLSGSFSGTITFAVTSGSLPLGITLTAGGILSGTPTSAAAFSFQITGTVA